MSVIDASVAAKWYLAEANSDVARALLDDDADLAAPHLIAVEVAAAIARRHRVGGLSLSEARRALDDWKATIRGGFIQIMPDADDLDAATELALTIGHPVQDCLYLALARRLGRELVTADERFAARARPLHRPTTLIGRRR